MICKYFIGSTKNAKKEALAAHEKIVEGWKDAIKAAEVAQDFWPLHVTSKFNCDVGWEMCRELLVLNFFLNQNLNKYVSHSLSLSLSLSIFCSFVLWSLGSSISR